MTAYVVVLKEQLRDNRDLASIHHLLPGRILDRLAAVNNPAQVLAGFLSEWIVGRLEAGRIDSILAARMESLVGVLVDSQGVYRNDALAKVRQLSPEARLRFHQEASQPTMEQLHDWLRRQTHEHCLSKLNSIGRTFFTSSGVEGSVDIGFPLMFEFPLGLTVSSPRV